MTQITMQFTALFGVGNLGHFPNAVGAGVVGAGDGCAPLPPRPRASSQEEESICCLPWAPRKEKALYSGLGLPFSFPLRKERAIGGPRNLADCFEAGTGQHDVHPSFGPRLRAPLSSFWQRRPGKRIRLAVARGRGRRLLCSRGVAK